MAEIELHFQDAFSGEIIQILLNGVLVSQRAMKTRYQTGLAHIEKLNVENGDKIEIRVADQSIASSINFINPNSNTINYKITMKSGRILIQYIKEPLLYL